MYVYAKEIAHAIGGGRNKGKLERLIDAHAYVLLHKMMQSEVGNDV